MDCPGFEKMIDYLDGRMAHRETSSIEEHLAGGCDSCASVRTWYERVRAIAAADDSLEPPGWVLKRALKAFMARRESYTAGLPRQMAAILVFDSMSLPEVAGTRSTDVCDRQMLYSAAGYSVDLQMVQANNSSINLAGQILKEGEEGFDSVSGVPLQLVTGGASAASTITNAIGEFRIDGIIRGKYDLYFEGRGRRIVIPGIPVSTTL